MKRLPLRWLVLAPLMLIVSVGAIAVGVYLKNSVRSDMIATVDEELIRALDARRVPPRRPADDGRPQADSALGSDRTDTGTQAGSIAPLDFALDADGNVQFRSPESADSGFDTDSLVDLYGATGNKTIDGEPRYRVTTAPGPDGRTLVVALSLERVDQSLASLHRNLIISGLVLFAGQVFALWFIAGAVARPVARMSKVAHDIAAGDLEATVGAPQGSRETAELATDLSVMLERLRATIGERESAAADANQARLNMERFMADASHELRTPLTALKGYSDLYQADMLDADGLDRAMDRIGSESERMTDLVIGLLDLMKEDSTDADELVNLQDVAATAVEDVSVAYPDRSVALSIDEALDPAVVLGSPSRLHQAMLNLLGNACQHTETTHPIEVVVRVEGAAAELAVVDHGDGIDVARADELFVAFARGDASRSRASHDGAGLGLALVRRIAERHGGSAWARATPGGGATFGMTLPLHLP